MADLLFNYFFQPSSLFTSKATSLKLVIENPLTGKTIQFAGGPQGDEIDIYFPIGPKDTDLSALLNFTVGSVSAGFTCGKSVAGDFFVLKSALGATITPGQQLEVLFNQVVVNAQPGVAQVKIQEYIGTSAGMGLVPVTKLQDSGLNVIAWLQPKIVGLGQLSQLNWQSVGGTYVEVAGFPGNPPVRDFPVKGEPPYPGNCYVPVLPDEAQRTYTVTVYTSDQKHAQQSVTVTQHNPIITLFTSNWNNIPLRVDDAVSLTWAAMYASAISLKPPGRPLNNPISPRLVVPGQELADAYTGNYANMPATVSYMLTAFGYQNNPAQTLTFTLASVGLAYFKYKVKNPDGTLSGVIWATDPASWKPFVISLNTNLNVYTVYQPGGTSNTYYLGSGDTVHPQIQYFDTAAGKDGEYTFSWVTANLKGLVLNPGNITIDAAQIKNGNKNLKPVASEYILTGTGNNGETIISKLGVPVKAALLHTSGNTTHTGAIQITNQDAIGHYFRPADWQMRDIETALSYLTFDDLWTLNRPVLIDTITVLAIRKVEDNKRLWVIWAHPDPLAYTSAWVVVPEIFMTAATAAEQQDVLETVKSALRRSCEDGNRYELYGN